MAGWFLASTRGPVSVMTLHNPDGHTDRMTYDILFRSHDDKRQRAHDLVRVKTRADDRPLNEVGLVHDVFANQVILPPGAPDLYCNPTFLWSEVDGAAWSETQHLLVGPTFWFPGGGPHHLEVRQVAEFAQKMLADRYGVAVHLVAHTPARNGKNADFHVHLLCTARAVTSGGFGQFIRELLDTGCQRQCKADWSQWSSTHPLLPTVAGGRKKATARSEDRRACSSI